jgi:predicted DNA-binding protein (UPF0251 family)
MARKDSPSGKTGSQKVKRAEKHYEALRLRRNGCTYDEIAAELGIGRSTAHEYVRSALADLAEQSITEANLLRVLLSERLDRLYSIAYKKAESEGDIKAVNTCVGIVRQQAELYGLNAGRQPINELAALEVLVRSGWIDGEVLGAIADRLSAFKADIAIIMQREKN